MANLYKLKQDPLKIRGVVLIFITFVIYTPNF